jgi:hypothetical protein
VYEMTYAALAPGEIATASKASQRGCPLISASQEVAPIQMPTMAQTASVCGPVRRFVDDAVSATTGWTRMVAFTTRARVAIAEGDTQQAERDAPAAFACRADSMAGSRQ